MRVTTKGQVTIPQHIRDRLGITPATEVDFIEEKGRIFLVQRKEEKADIRKYAKLRGLASVKMTTDEIMMLTRSEVSIAFEKIEELESALHNGGFQLLEIPKEALFLAGKAYLRYRRGKGKKRSSLPDFYIGAQAAILGMDLITRDVSRCRTYFPTVRIICPER
ncbi:MAG: PIN domain-containing protein [Pseudomonadota bacterium]